MVESTVRCSHKSLRINDQWSKINNQSEFKEQKSMISQVSTRKYQVL